MQFARHLRAAGFAGLVFAIGLTLTACASADPGPAGSGQPTTQSTTRPAQTGNGTGFGASQTIDAGQVTVKVDWVGRGDTVDFEVTLDTHAVDLDAIDLTKQAVLLTDQGREVRPSAWDAPKGGHHRVGKLVFPSRTADGAPLIDGNTGALELVVKDVAGVPARTFRWVP